MPESDPGSNRISVIETAGKTSLTLFVLLVLVIEGGLLAVAKMVDGENQAYLLGGMIVVLLVAVVFGGIRLLRDDTIHPGEIQTIWSGADLPLTQAIADAWRGKWQAAWTVRRRDGSLAPYTDDLVRLDTIDLETGFVQGTGFAAKESGVTYRVSGRISQRGLGVFYYSSAGTKYDGLDGVFILRRLPGGSISGWWLGPSLTGEEVQGRVEFARPREGDGFVSRQHAYEPG